MASTAISAQGSTISINTGTSETPVWTPIKNVLSFEGFDGSASEIDVTDLSSTAKEFRLGLTDAGNFNFELNIDRADAGQVAVEAARVSGAVTGFQLELPNGDTATFDTLVKSTPMSGGVDAVVKGSVQTKITGAVTWA